MLEHWHDIANDLHDVYGVDVWDRSLMCTRNWGWLRERILGLLDRPPVWVALGDRACRMYTTRVQEAVFGPRRDAELDAAATDHTDEGAS